MGNAIVDTIIKSVITGILGYLLGYCISLIKSYRKKIKDKESNENIQNVAIRSILKSQLAKTFFVYSELKQIPDYIYQDFLEMLKVYETFGGNGYIHTLAKKMESWEIVKTDVLK